MLRSATAPAARVGESPAGHTARAAANAPAGWFSADAKAKQHLDLVQELVAEAASHRIGQRCEILHVANQCAQQNCSRRPSGGETTVLTRVVATHHPAERLAEELHENVGAFDGSM